MAKNRTNKIRKNSGLQVGKYSIGLDDDGIAIRGPSGKEIVIGGGELILAIDRLWVDHA